MNDRSLDATTVAAGCVDPAVFMIIMLTWSVILFGIDAAAGPLQVALLMSAVVAGVVAHKNGHHLGECWAKRSSRASRWR